MASDKAAEEFEALFRFVPVLYPQALQILTARGLTGPTFFALSYLKHFGTKTSVGHGLLLGDFSDVLLRALIYDDESGPSRLITKLVDGGWVQKRSISKRDKATYFPDSSGTRTQATLAALTDEGYAVLKVVNRDASAMIEHVIDGGMGYRRLFGMLLTHLGKNFDSLQGRLDDWEGPSA